MMPHHSSTARAARQRRKQCQLTAWKSGHKHKCSSLVSKIPVFEQMIQEVDDMHERGVCHGLRLDLTNDYGAVANSFGSRERWNVPVDIDGPSVNIYYANLGRIINGKWWLFSNPTKYEPKRKPEKVNLDPQDFSIISILLMYDVIPDTEDESGSHGTLDRIPSHPSVLDFLVRFKRRIKTPMAASQFLACYAQQVGDGKVNGPALTKMMKKEALSIFCWQMHK